jgi:methionine-gamma-lyase
MKRKPEGYIGKRELKPESLMMSYGYEAARSEGAIKCPIFQTSTFVFKTAEEGKRFFEIAYGLKKKGPKEELGLIYSRLNNPDLEILEDRLTLWDEAEACAVFESGMAAISTLLLEYASPGDLILHSEPIYGGTDYFLHHVLPRFGVATLGFPADATEEDIRKLLKKSGKADKLAIVLVETPSNPTNRLIDVEACSRIAKDAGVPLAVDNTFLGPLWQHPLKLGADFVLYSATKFIGGHSDVIAGVCLGSAEGIQRVRTLRTFLGTLAGPWTGWLLLRSLETLKLRMTCQMKNARYVADYLNDHPKVKKVHYLGLLEQGTREHEIYKRACVSPGSMISFDIKGGQKAAFRFLNALKLFTLAVSLGGTESLAEHPGTMTHADVAPKDQRRMGIGDGMVRLSIGVENPEDLVADLKQAFDKV